ncbi:uncharacterized protein O3C94_016483 [Discoglossus pictus]
MMTQMNTDTVCERILNHTLEIQYLLTGEVKKTAERILHHALEIIYLLTGEEYTIVKKTSPHIHQLTGEIAIKCDNDDIAVNISTEERKYKERHKNDTMMETPQTLRNIGITDSGQEVEEKEGMKIKDEIPSNISLGHQSMIEPYGSGQQDIKEEEIPIDICEAAGLTNRNISGRNQKSVSYKYFRDQELNIIKNNQEENFTSFNSLNNSRVGICEEFQRFNWK